MKNLRLIALGVFTTAALAVLVNLFPSQANAGAYGYTTGEKCTAYTYRIGNRSTCTKYIQTMLNGFNYYYKGASTPGGKVSGVIIATDGAFGSKTDEQVRIFQRLSGLTADGIVGKNTWSSLCYYAGAKNFLNSPIGSYPQQAWGAAWNAGCRVDYGGNYPL